MPGSAILDDLMARGLLHDSTDLESLRTRLDDAPIVVYAGFDPTADSLHVAHLVPLLLLRRFQLAGHRPIALAGGATGMVGDPSGRSAERNLLDGPTLDHNLSAIAAQLSRFLDFEGIDGAAPAELVDNRDWTAPVSVLDFLRDVGKHITVNQMLAKESVRQRIESEQGISFTEFSYMLLQANDFRWLHEHRSCELQLGGSDQWGNITAGIDLIRRTEGAHVHGLTVPLMTKADGTKFGKTADGAVWLDPARTSPYELYQYFVNTDDRDVERFLAQLTLLDLEEIAVVMASHQVAPERREAQRTLALALTSLIHGDTAAEDARAASSNFTRRSAELDVAELEQLAGEIPTSTVGPTALADTPLSRLLADVGLASSLSDARRTLAGGGVYVNDVAQADDRLLAADDVLHGRFVVLRKGKRNRHLLVVSDTEHS